MTSVTYFFIGAMAGMAFTLIALVSIAVKVDKERKK